LCVTYDACGAHATASPVAAGKTSIIVSDATRIEPDGMLSDRLQQKRSILALWSAGKIDRALAEAWRAFDTDRGDRGLKIQLARILSAHASSATWDSERDLHHLLNDPDIDPVAIAPAGWSLLLRGGNFFRPDMAATAARLEQSAFARDLLKATYVASLDVEAPLTRVRRWLFLSGQWETFPQSTAALAAQAARNCGAWIFDDDERAALEDCDVEIRHAYMPERAIADRGDVFADPVTSAVAEQYEGWPYPVWSRAMAEPGALGGAIRALDTEAIDLPPDPHILIAGCGTGHEAAMIALQCPQARVVAIDISAASLRYAAQRCGELCNVEFRQLDLHRAAKLDRPFDIVVCSGVLHHLPDPEQGWAALVGVLKPRGLMKVMLYSKAARENVRAARAAIADIAEAPVTDDLLRAVRRRLIAAKLFPRSRDFFTLPGVHDLLLHRHEDPFDIPRIARALTGMELDLLGFTLSNPRNEALYAKENPHDPRRRDFNAWAALEKRKPEIFGGMYEFWCRRRAS
jgi:SAM-dependent methyltransferase